MALIFRILRAVAIVCIAGLAAVGLLVQYRVLPAGTLDGARELTRSAQSVFHRAEAVSAYQDSENSSDREHKDSSRSVLHGLIGCEPGGDDSPEPVDERRVHSWRDVDGVMNFADSAEVQNTRPPHTHEETEDFFVNVLAENAVLPANLEGAIRAGAVSSYAQWREWLDRDELVRARINIRFLGDAETFSTVYGKPNRDGWTTTGFYRVRSNEALILYTPAFRGSALGTTYHEMSHLITAWHLGSTPPWLNEGIAEYFETMQFGRQNVEFLPNPLHLELLRQNGPVPLAELTSLTRKEWGRRDPLLRYASAWSLIAFLFDSPQGQTTLRQVVRRAHEQRCESRSDLQNALDGFPGGVSSLEAQWHRWVSDA